MALLIPSSKDIWGDGTQVRDFIHIIDIVKAVDAAITQDYLQPLNLGNSEAVSFNEFAGLVAKIVGYEPTFRHLPAEPVGVMYRVSDNTNMLKVYAPQVSFEDGIKRAIKGWI